MNFLTKYKLILASKSPRRKELLENARIPFEIRLKEVEETYPPGMIIHDVPKHIARLKAEPFQSLKEDEVLLTADTMVVLGTEILGKPKDRDNAFEILKKLSGAEHTVITGVHLKSNTKDHTFDQHTEVVFYPLTDKEINYYIDEFEPFDKAGAYGIQDWIGLCKVNGLRGSYSNVMGLPMERLYHELRDFTARLDRSNN